MPQGKRRFYEVKTKFEEWKFWKLKIVKKDKNKVESKSKKETSGKLKKKKKVIKKADENAV